VHRFLGLLTGTFVVVHGGALLLDGYLPFSVGQLLIPGTAPYRPLAVSFGVVAAELLAALAVTTTTASGSRTASGGVRTTSTSPSGCSRSCTG
jgi:hypothetical protein